MLVSDERAYTSEEQFAPLRRHASMLRRRLGVVSFHVPLAQALAMPTARLRRVELVVLKLVFETPPAEAQRIVAHFAQALSGSGVRLAYFDGDDDLCIQWPGVLRQVDGYVKKHVFADRDAYLRSYLGKSNLTDHVSRQHGRSFADNIIPSSGPVPGQDLAKLHLGWNIGLDDKIAELALQIGPPVHEAKDIDIGSRAYVKPEIWTHPLRDPVVEKLAAISDKYRVLAPRERVSQQQYYDEMKRARICVSPFGYGELCWRDFEAILCGCLLVKPDMGHVRTWPDVFVDGVTYAAVRWDYADLEEVCARYLADEPLRRKIADHARDVLLRSLTDTAFVEVFAATLKQMGIAVPAG